MTYVTVSVPITTTLHDAIDARIKRGEFANRAEYFRKAAQKFNEDLVAQEILEARQEAIEGKVITLKKNEKLRDVVSRIAI